MTVIQGKQKENEERKKETKKEKI